MGGMGSGRQSYRQCTSDLLALDVRAIARSGRLTPGRSFTWFWCCAGEWIATIGLAVKFDHVTLDYRNRGHHDNDGEWESMNYPVSLDWTTCGFGGRRAWWRCPGVGCGRRVAVLYGGRVFACRQCHDLAYRSQREADHDRATRRVDTIRRRLGWEPGILNGDGGKPKGMHWGTFDRLQLEHDARADAALIGMSAKLALLRGKLEGIDAEVDRWRLR